MNKKPKPRVFGIEDTTVKPIETFVNAEEAWFWYMRCEKAKLEGAKGPRFDAVTTPPCEPIDIMRWINMLWDRGKMYPAHLEVMGEYGYLERRPDPEESEEELIDFLIWVHAFKVFEPTLIEKGVVG